MSATIDRPRITAAELAEGEAQYAAITRELATAKAKAEQAARDADEQWNSVSAQRYSHECGATVKHLTEKANRLAAFLQSADVIDPEPEPTPPAPAARPAGIIERNRRVITAKMYGTCRCCQRAITPGERITTTYVRGTWAHEGCWNHDQARILAESEDRRLGAMFLAFIERLPAVA